MFPNELAKIAKPARWLWLGWLMAAGLGHAQESGSASSRVTDAPAPASVRAETLAELLKQARQWIQSGKATEAYALLAPREYDHAGNVEFDYLLGIAALDSGKPDKATFAFERVLAVHPDHAAARLDMARAYYQLGDLPRARTEFAAALELGPSATARANIQKYLDEIDAQKDDRRTRLKGYVELGVGRDDNVNLATSDAQVKVFVAPSWIDATLNPSNTKMAGNYYGLGAGGEVSHSLSANWGLYAGADWRKRGIDALSQFDAVNTDLRAGLTYETLQNRLRLGIARGQYHLGGSHYSDNTGFKGEWRHMFSPYNHLNLFAHSLQYRYLDAPVQSNDFDQSALGLGWLHRTADAGSSLSGGIYVGAEKDVSPIISTANPDGGRNDGAKNFWGLRIGGQSVINGRTSLFATTGLQIGDYSKTNYYFLRQRHDRLIDLTMGVNWLWDKQWTLRPQLSYATNDSNIGIYGYSRMDFSLTVRRDFR